MLNFIMNICQESKMNKKGFTYIVVIFMLGLLAFMGLFLHQGSTTEYSHASLSIYRTMLRQLSEAAADEAFCILNEEFKKKGELFQTIMQKASKSGSPRPSIEGKSIEINAVDFGSKFSELKDKVEQSIILKDDHLTRAGFIIEKIQPTITDCRPIPNNYLDYEEAYYRSQDREKPFDTELSRDWYMTLRLDIRVALKKVAESKMEFTISKDMKLMNMGPMARNYSMFSIHGNRELSGGTQQQISYALESQMVNPASGCLFLWNMPFQSRVYLHGPSIISLDNPSLITHPETQGAYALGEDELPGFSQAYQYSDTFYGLSMFTNESRAVFPDRNNLVREWQTVPDKDDDVNIDGRPEGRENIMGEKTTGGGWIPEANGFRLKNVATTLFNSLQDEYFRGTVQRQSFAPAGLLCRMPWRNYESKKTVTKKDRYLPNSKDIEEDTFPKDGKLLKLEHRWDPEDSSVSDSTMICERVLKVKYNYTMGKATKMERELTEFGISYYNNPNKTSIIKKVLGTIGDIFKHLYNVVKIPFQLIGNGWGLIKNKFWPTPESIVAISTDNIPTNMFPTNFKHDYKRFVTRHYESEKDIPMDEETGSWILNGVYWLDSCQIEKPITYVGTGTIIVSKYNPNAPFKISGDVLALTDSSGNKLGHLNIIYNPERVTNEQQMEQRMLLITSRSTVEASIYSLYGIKATAGKISNEEFVTCGVIPNMAWKHWNQKPWAENILRNTNVIKGNYINYYMNLNLQGPGDLWVYHDSENPLYFSKTSDGLYPIVQELLDSDEDFRKNYETKVHEIYLSPKIQHIGFTGGNKSSGSSSSNSGDGGIG